MQEMSWGLDRLQREARRAAGWATTGLGFTIPIWVVADSILVVLLVGCWVVSGKWRERGRRVMTNPVGLSASLLFGWLLVGTLWGMGSLEERMLAVKKYADLYSFRYWFRWRLMFKSVVAQSWPWRPN